MCAAYGFVGDTGGGLGDARRLEDERLSAWRLALALEETWDRRSAEGAMADLVATARDACDDEGGDEGAGMAQLRALVVAGTPMALRRAAWCAFLELDRIAEPGAYEASLRAANDEAAATLAERDAFLADAADKSKPPNPKLRGHGQHWAVQIEKDVPRTAAHHPLIANAHALGALRNVLRAHAHRNPRCRYCQGLNFVAAVLLLVLDAEADAFWALCRLSEDRLCGYWDMAGAADAPAPAAGGGPPAALGLVAATDDADILSELARVQLPTVHARLHALGQDTLRSLGLSWLVCLFVNSLPWGTVLHVWDAVFLEPDADGTRGALLRVALALLDLTASAVVGAEEGVGAMFALRDSLARFDDATTLLVCASAQRHKRRAEMKRVAGSPLPASFGPSCADEA